MKKSIILFLAIILVIGIATIMVQAQVVNRISARCNAGGTIEIDYAYKIYQAEGYTNYIAMLTAGRCQREFRGTVQRTTNLNLAIAQDINSQINTRNISFFPDPFGELDVDGRGSFSLP